VVLLAGLPASGKTTLARQLEAEGRAVRFTLDEWMLRLHGLSYDHPDYPDLAERCQDLIWDLATQVLRTGADVILDWNQWSRGRRARWRDRAEAGGWHVVLYHLDVPTEQAAMRAQGRTSATAHSIDLEGVRHLASLFEPPDASEGLDVIRIAG
jgi:predicted kinase